MQADGRRAFMSETTEFTLGSEVVCSDGECGELTRVVVDPVARMLTHLVVGGRLVPIELVDRTAQEIRLGCTTSEFEALDDAQETQFLPEATGEWDYGQGKTFSWPYFALGLSVNEATTYDRVPVGEVEVRRGQHVHATDGAIGQVRGLVVDPRDHHVTHVLLDEGHLWGKKRVAIPISAVKDVKDGVRLNLTKHQVRDLPLVDLDHPE
jgi:sporulation protein YlmC with PRC-barrel domain